MGTLPYPGGQIIDADMARSLHADACRDHAAVAWAVLWDLPAYPERYAARLITSARSDANKRSSFFVLLVAGGQLGRDPGDAAAWLGTVRADVG
jgi:hypothetical protein